MIQKLSLSDETMTILENFNGLFLAIDRDYAALRTAISEINQEQEDLLHELELSPLDAVERSIVANKLIEVRKVRRQLLNDFAVIDPFLQFRRGHDTWAIPLASLQKRMRKIRDAQDNRQYTPRRRQDIKLFRGELANGDAEDE